MTLVEDLQNYQTSGGGKKKSGLRRNDFELPQGPISSWKFNDWDYYKQGLPVYARGLFTAGNDIVVRGYNKFFNIDETPATKWSAINQTLGPYECTSKENGCIIFMAAYKGELVVTSKHSVGFRADSAKNHSLAGLDWVRKHLASVGVSEQELVKELADKNLTAVGELCDDDFEEHVLSYKQRPGIYLTGLNENTREFRTRPFDQVQAFANKYGFIVTDYCTFNSVTELREFVDKCAETGSWNGREIEGFVVRCKQQSGETFFFKYKFDEPYFMYRQWREATKAYIKDPSTMPRLHARHAKSCQEYLKFAARYLSAHPELKYSILQGKGIIELRQHFIESAGIDEAALLQLGLQDLQTKYVLVPVATIGCGKTTVAKALEVLTGCAVVQNDSIPSGKTKQAAMIRKCCEALNSSNILFFDRNNHQIRERKQLFEDLGSAAAVHGWKPVYICLNFLPEGPGKRDWNITRDRVVSRGDAHQTITGMPPKTVEGIMKGFVGRFERVHAERAPDSAFDSVIDLDVTKGSEENVRRVVAKLRSQYQIECSDNFGEAMKTALAYKASPIKSGAPASKFVQYFGVGVDPKDLADIELPKEFVPLTQFHVTVAHPKPHPEKFKQLKAAHLKKLEMPGAGLKKVDLGVPVTVTVKSLCFNSRVAALDVDCEPSANERPHITMGLANGARPHESNEMLQQPDTTVEVRKTLQGQLYAFL